MGGKKRDFSTEIQNLQLLAGERKGLGQELMPGPFADQKAYHFFYLAARTEFRRNRIAGSTRNARYGRLTSYHDLPRNPKSHIRGYIEGNRYYLTQMRKDGKWMNTGSVCRRCTFHSQPTENLDSDSPANGDIFDFLKYPHLRHVVVGPKFISILDKDYETLKLSLALWRWEADNSYKLVRVRKRHADETELEHRERYAKIALRGIGLHWPYRKAERRREWPTILKEIGIPVHQMETRGEEKVKPNIPGWNEVPPSTVDTVLSILKGETTAEAAADRHHVGLHEVERWVSKFVNAGTAALLRKPAPGQTESGSPDQD